VFAAWIPQLAARKALDLSSRTTRGWRYFSSAGDPETGDYDDEPTVIFRKGELPSAFD
jgi:hypothetical protein